MTKPFAASAAGRRWLSLWTALVTLLFAGSAFAQVQRGPMPVLGLRAPDGEDEAAAVATASLRRTASRAGFTVPDNTPALEQLIAAFGCDDAVPVECLRQIATHINAPRFLYGSVRRAGRRRETAPVRLEVVLFDTATGQPTPPSQTELPRAQAVDEDRWHAATEQVLRAILPAQPATANNGNANGNGAGNGNGNGNGNVVTPPAGPAQPGAPIRRYVGYGAIGVGAVVGIVGAVVGATGYFGLTGQINGDAEIARANGLRTAPQDVQSFNDLYPTDTQVGQSVSGDSICASLDNPSTLRYIGAQSNRDAALVGARNVCNSRSSTVTTMGALVGVGAAVLVAGVILVVTDNTPSAAPQATANTTAAARSQHNLRAQWTVSPVINQQTQGAVLNLRF